MSTLNERIREELLRFEKELEREGFDIEGFKLEQDEEFELLLRDCLLLYGEETFPSINELTDLTLKMLGPAKVEPELAERVLAEAGEASAERRKQRLRLGSVRGGHTWILRQDGSHRPFRSFSARGQASTTKPKQTRRSY